MARRQNSRFSIYDAMEARGVFDDNPANAQSDAERDGLKFSTFPNRFPMMFYHPEGKERTVTPAEVINTPLGPKFVNEHKELISTIAQNSEDERKLREAGWHDHPSKANGAAGRAVAPTSAGDTIANLQGEIARLQAQLNSESARQLNPQSGASATQPDPAKAIAEVAASAAKKVGV